MLSFACLISGAHNGVFVYQLKERSSASFWFSSGSKSTMDVLAKEDNSKRNGSSL